MDDNTSIFTDDSPEEGIEKFWTVYGRAESGKGSWPLMHHREVEQAMIHADNAYFEAQELQEQIQKAEEAGQAIDPNEVQELSKWDPFRFELTEGTCQATYTFLLVQVSTTKGTSDDWVNEVQSSLRETWAELEIEKGS